VIKSAIPADSFEKLGVRDHSLIGEIQRWTYVSAFDPLKNSKQNSLISIRPILRIAAFVFPPIPNPSTNPAARATMFFKAPERETPITSSTTDTLNVGESNTAFQSSESSADGVPMVVSQN
jgi:hypothetical protein